MTPRTEADQTPAAAGWPAGSPQAAEAWNRALALAPVSPRMMVPTRLLRTEWPPDDGVQSGNARFDDILDSMLRDGIREPLTINLNWLVIDGHHRLSAARQLGLEWVPVRVWTGVEFLPHEAEYARLAAEPSDTAAEYEEIK